MQEPADLPAGQDQRLVGAGRLEPNKAMVNSHINFCSFQKNLVNFHNFQYILLYCTSATFSGYYSISLPI
jgi:hypothetical protein